MAMQSRSYNFDIVQLLDMIDKVKVLLLAKMGTYR